MQDESYWNLRGKIQALAIDPPYQHWLESDAGISYCWDCAVQARAGEVGQALPYKPETPYYECDEVEQAVDGGSWYSATSDDTQQCYTCGQTLHFWLTEEGIADEIQYAEEMGPHPNPAEEAYLIDRLFECSDEQWPRVKAIAERFLAAQNEGAHALPATEIRNSL